MYTWFENGHLNEIFIPTHIYSFLILNICEKKLDACLQNNHLNEIFIYSSLHVCFNTPVYQFLFFILHN